MTQLTQHTAVHDDAPSTTRALPDVLLVVGWAILWLVGAVVVLHSVVFVVGGTMYPAVTALAVLLTAVALWFVTPGSARLRVGALMAFAGTLVVSLVVSLLTVDRSYDGNSYHKVAVGALANGWNPVRGSVEAFSAATSSPITLDHGDLFANWGFWVDHYPKATWVFGASLYQLTGDIEAGKALAPLCMIAAFLIGSGYLARRIGAVRGVAVALVAALNPVALAQVTSFYTDGVLASLLLVAVLLLTMTVDDGWTPSPVQARATWISLALVVALLAGVKYTGLLYAGIFGLCYFAVLALRRERNRTAMLSLAAAGASGAAVGVLVIGASSYVRNLVVEHNPLYPLIGRGSVDIVTQQAPAGFASMSAVKQFVLANLGASQEDPAGGARLKVPFTFRLDELHQFANTDVRVGGYGVLFSGILLVTLALGIYLLVRHSRRHARVLPLFLAPVVATLVGVLVVQGSWWARYTPQLWFVPLVVVVALFCLGWRVVPWALVALMLVDVAPIGALQAHSAWETRGTALSLADAVKRVGGQCPAIYAPVFDGAVYNYLDAVPGITVLTPAEFAALPRTDFTELYAGVLVRRGSC